MKRFFAILLSSLIFIPALRAQEAADTLLRLSEVSVTAVKGGTQPLQLQPVAATVVGVSEVERLNIMTMKDVSEIAPNFYIPDYGSRMTSTIYMRGIGARIDQPVVGLNVDNVPFLNKDNYDFDLVDIDRIEVIRGPQSTLYGRNTMGGQINIYTLSPMRWQGFRLMAEAGTGTTLRAAASGYHRFSAPLGMAVSGYFNHTDGYWRNSYDNSKVGRENAGSARWKTVWSPASDWMLENTASFTINRQNGYPYESAETGMIDYNDPTYYHRWSFNDGLTVKYSGKGFSATSITSVQYLDDDMTLDQDFLPMSYFTLTQARKETSLTQDFIFRGSRGCYSWLAGAFAFYKHHNMSAPVTFKADGIERLIVGKRNELNPQYPAVWTEDSFVLGSDFTNTVYGIAAYHRSSVTLGRWEIEGALRLDYEHNNLDYHSHCATAYDVMDMTDPSNPAVYRHQPVEINDRGELNAHFTQLLPKLSVSYKLPTRLPSTAYLSIAKGYKAGGFNTQMFSDVLQQRLMGIMGLTSQYDVDEIISYKPEHSWNYELGASIAMLSGRLTADFAAFYIDCRNQQLTMFPEGNTTGRIMVNAGQTRSAGVEMAATYAPTSRWLFNASWGFCDAKFVEFDNGRQSFSGCRVPFAPKNTIFAGATYTHPFSAGRSLSLNVNVRALGSIEWDEANTLSQPLYALAGASATWTVGDLQLKVWGENLTATKYTTFYFVSVGNAFVQRGRGASAGVTLRWAFASL